MLVRELIAKLLDMPMDAEVMVWGEEDNVTVLDVYDDVIGPIGGPQETTIVFLRVED